MFSGILAVLFTMVDNAAHCGSDNDDLFTSKKCAQNEFVGTDARFFFYLCFNQSTVLFKSWVDQ
jgi:hypothetical protein